MKSHVAPWITLIGLLVAASLTAISDTLASDADLSDRYPELGMARSISLTETPLVLQNGADKTLSYPGVDSVTVGSTLAFSGGVPVDILVYVTNPHSSPFAGAEITLTIIEPVSNYQTTLPPQTATLAASAQTIVTIPWVPDPVLGGLQFQVSARMALPVKGNKVNLVTNGSFDSSCSGWTIDESYPPTLGTECSFGTLRTYTSIYNTTAGRWTRAYQIVDLSGVDFDDFAVQFAASYATDSGFYGHGMSQTSVGFYDSSLAFLGAAYQRAYIYGVPPDTDTEHYSLVQQNKWLGYNESISSILGKLPGVNSGSVAYLAIMTLAMPVCSAPYCSPSAHVYLDDVAVTDSAALVSFSQDVIMVSNLTAEIIGDRETIIRDCLGGYSPCESSFVDRLPMVQAFSIWDRSSSYLCAAGVHHAAEDEVQAFMAELNVGIIWFDYGKSLIESLLEPGSAFGISATSEFYAAGSDAIQCSLLGLESAAKAQESEKSIREDVTAWRAVLNEQSELYRDHAFVSGELQVAILAGGYTTDEDTIRHVGVFQTEFPNAVRLVALDDSVRVLGTANWLDRDQVVDVNLVTLATGDVSLSVLHQFPTGRDTVVEYSPLWSPAGARLSFAFAAAEEAFEVAVDWSNDGVVDTTITPMTASTVTQERLPQHGIAGVRPYPNPFNPTLNIEVLLDEDTDLELAVYDARGHRISGVFAGPAAAGATTYQWTGRDDRGRTVSSGVYFVRVRTAAQVMTRRVALLR